MRVSSTTFFRKIIHILLRQLLLPWKSVGGEIIPEIELPQQADHGLSPLLSQNGFRPSNEDDLCSKQIIVEEELAVEF